MLVIKFNIFNIGIYFGVGYEVLMKSRYISF